MFRVSSRTGDVKFHGKLLIIDQDALMPEQTRA